MKIALLVTYLNMNEKQSCLISCHNSTLHVCASRPNKMIKDLE